MERLIMNDLLKWKNKPSRKPLLFTGVRQCGKTYILKEFGSRYFEDVAYFNFEENEVNDDLRLGESGIIQRYWVIL